MQNKNYISSSFKLENYETKSDGSKYGQGLFSGYASTFQKDRGNDIIMPGAFLESLRDRKSEDMRISILWQHDVNNVIGSISYDDLIEDSHGLKIINGGGRLNLNVDKAREVFELLKSGDVSRLSIGYGVKDFEWENDSRILKKIEIYEVSVVSEPMNTGAKIYEVKAATQFKNLPLANSDHEWDSSAAIKRIREFTNSTDIPSSQYKNAFFWYDQSKQEDFGSYKLPFADVIDGKLTAVPHGIFAAAAALEGARGGVDIPESDRASVVKHVESYYKKMEHDSPFEASDKKNINDASFFIDAAKAKDINTKRDFEKVLLDSGLFSRNAAKILIKNFEPKQSESVLNDTNLREAGKDKEIDNKAELKSICESLKELIKLSKN